MEETQLKIEKDYLKETIALVNSRLKELEQKSQRIDTMLNDSNKEYFEYLNRNANKINDDDFVEIINMQSRLDDLQDDTIDMSKSINICKKMLNKPYFASILLHDSESDSETYYIGLNSLAKNEDEYQVVDWRSPIASIFYDVENGKCQIKTKSSVLNCYLDRKRQFGISNGNLDYYIDSDINIEDDILKVALAKNTSNQMKSIVETIQKEQNSVIRGDEYTNMIVQGVAGSGKTAIALHRIAYLLYKMKGKVTADNIKFISPNNAFSSYISTVLPDLAEDDIDKVQIDELARNYLKNHCIVEKKFEQIERLVLTQNLNEYKYKTSLEFLQELIDYAHKNYIDNFDIQDFDVNGTTISHQKILELFFGKYKDRDLFTRLKWITDNVFDLYFYRVKSVDKTLRYKQFIFMQLYKSIKNKNCVKAYMNFLAKKGLKLELVGNKVKNEDVYGILFFKMFIYGLDKFENVKHLLIDEMQDYSAVQMYILHNLFDCTYTMLGDFNQTLCPESSKILQNNLDKILDEKSVHVELNKTYRSSRQIVEFYNKVGNKTNVNYVSRDGEPVEFVKTQKDSEVGVLQDLIAKYKAKGYNSIAIITKTNKQASLLAEQFEQAGIIINLIDDNTDKYNNDVCIISIYNSKGLEFDGVIVYNVGEDYSSDIDKNLLYIACTRALHKLTLTCNENEFSKLIID